MRWFREDSAEAEGRGGIEVREMVSLDESKIQFKCCKIMD